MSASSAPAARKLCRIAMTSRGVDPIEPSARTSSSTVAPCLSTRLRYFSALAPTETCGTTAVCPCERGAGCETVFTV